MVVKACSCRPLVLPGLLLLSFLLLADADSPPRFTRTPEDQTGVQGGVASFVCQATGDPQPKIVWNKKGKKVSSQRFEVIEFDDGSGSVLRIQPLRTPRDEAVYECHASNSAGELTATTRLNVLREDQLPAGFPTIDMGPQLKVVERSRTATMLCAASGNPDPEITWFKDFLPVNTSNNNGRIKQLRSESFGGTPIRGALQIEMSEESDQGKYECVATNSDGTRYSTPANLYVRVRRVPPRFSIPPADSEIMPGGNVNITCVAVGSPMPYVKWMLGAEDLTPEDDMPIGRNVLELTDVRQSNNYTCVAMSTLGVIEAVAQIIVKALPKPPGAPVVTERTATSITLTWDSGNPEPVSYYIIQHRAKGSEDPYKEIDGIATTRYSVGGLSPYSHYDFRVAAVNTIGQGPSSDMVEARTAEQAPSSPPRQVRGRMLSTTTAIIHWDEPEEPNGQVVGYRVYYTTDNMLPVNQWEKQMVRSANFITIQSLTPNKTYYIRVLAFTSVGDGPLSQDLQIIAKTGVPSQPSDFKGEAKSETSILLSWVAPPQGGPDNQITGYELVYRRSDETEEKKATFEPTTSYLLKNLKPFSTYTFQLAAKSKHGIGAYTNEVSIDTPQTLPAAPPQNITCTSPTSTSILVSWAPPPVEFQNGIISGYAIQYSNTEGNKTFKTVNGISPESTSFLLENLEKWTEYGITVRAQTEAGDGPESLQLLIRTDEDVPSGPPRGVEAETVNASALRVKWRAPAPERQHGQIRGYQVHYVQMNYGEPQGQPFIKDILIEDSQWGSDESTEYEVVLGDLKADTSYSVSVGAYTAKGDGARSKPVSVCTALPLPEMPKLMVSATEAAKENRYTAQDIHKGASYVFRLSSRNKMGYGDEAVKEVSTPEDAPSGYPENIISEEAAATSMRLAWKTVPLIEQNGKITKYSVLYKDVNSRGNASEVVVPSPKCSVVLEGLIPDTVYEVRVCASTGVGQGPYSPSVQFRTQRLDQVFATNFRVKAAMKNSVLLSWEIRDKNPVQPFTILYGKGQSVEVDGKQTQKLITGLEPDTQYSFLLTNRANSAGGLQHRVTATTAPDLLKTKPTVVGKTNADGMVTVQLPTVQTTAKVRGYYVVVVPLKRQRGGKFLNPWEEPDQMNLDELLKEINRTSVSRALRIRRQAIQSDPRAYVSAHFKTLPLEFTLGDGRNYGDFRNRPLQNGQEYVFFVLALLDLSENTMFSTSPYSDPVTSSDVDPQPIIDEEEGYCGWSGHKPDRKRAEAEGRKASFPCSKAMSSHHPTDPVELRRINFQTPAYRVSVYRGYRRLSICGPWQQFTWENSNLEVNKPKNRYANVIAYDHSRVILSSIEGVPGSDYINANYIDGYRRQNAYIATQGPLPETFGDFWRMVWEQHTANIIMMTKLEEKSRGTETYGLIQVTLLDTVELATYSVRTFALYKSGSNEKREVRHFQFTAWPDHGVPEHPTPFLAFLRRVKACNPPDAGPMVVHCSAGVGRTGCFIVIDAMTERIKHEKTMDIYGHVTLMRSQRNYMVQTEDQYIFIHDALLEAVTCGNTEVPARNLYSYIQRLTQIEPGENVTGMEVEFKRLASAKAHTSRFVSANLPCNKFKNRLVNIMPYETTRVCLQPIRGVEGSDYINASFIDGYRQQKAYIATQGKWAGRNVINTGPQSVQPDARDGQSRTVRQFQFTDWPEQGVPKSGEGFIDFIGQVHKTKEQFGQDGPITVHCSAGVGRTGVFITLSIVLERMRYEGVVDIFQTVKMLRTQRPATVQTEDQYQFCYRASLEYLGSFDHYAT
ncbi:hypothetical protein WMY93_006417 [Mugilogobius chulae]|uniref:Receptor-type tyrosine-protein phosphatase delta n=1 Tax=Mugilogobius chulae TaxID=88201 RepID=A0AAW0PK43_9GOBI